MRLVCLPALPRLPSLAGVRGPPAAAERLAGVRGSASELPAACWRGRALAGVGGSALELFHSPDGPLAALQERLQAVPSFCAESAKDRKSGRPALSDSLG